MDMLSSFSMGALIAGFFFGLIGMAAFGYGKKQGNYNAMGIGAALMVYPYFVTNTLATVAIGIALTASLFYFRD